MKIDRVRYIRYCSMDGESRILKTSKKSDPHGNRRYAISKAVDVAFLIRRRRLQPVALPRV